MKHTSICLVSLLGGMVVGSALAMLMTPQSGPELRAKIKDWVEEEVDKAKMKAEKLQEQIKSQIEEARCKCETKEA
ncbi:MAG: YtxH domain-containing protein [Alistipes sp.]|nr:YtxH domain-containing protein [Alistipes sp.]